MSLCKPARMKHRTKGRKQNRHRCQTFVNPNRHKRFNRGTEIMNSEVRREIKEFFFKVASDAEKHDECIGKRFDEYMNMCQYIEKSVDSEFTDADREWAKQERQRSTGMAERNPLQYELKMAIWEMGEPVVAEFLSKAGTVDEGKLREGPAWLVFHEICCPMFVHI